MRFIWLVVLPLCSLGCFWVFVEPYELFLDPSEYIFLETKQKLNPYRYHQEWSKHGLSVVVSALYGRDFNIRKDSSLVTLIVNVYPREKHKLINFIPNTIRITTKSDTLELVKSKKTFIKDPNGCSYRASFSLTQIRLSLGTISKDTMLFSIDLSEALSYNDSPLDMGIIRGKYYSNYIADNTTN